MRNDQDPRNLSYLKLLMAFAIMFLSRTGSAEPWDFGVNIDWGVIFTDNIFLENDGFEESETVYTISPEIYLTTDGDRVDAEIRYRPEAYFYQTNDDANGVFDVVDATMTTAVVRDRLFLLLNASKFQSIISPVIGFPTSNIPISQNRVDSRVLEARPYWEQRVASADLLIEAAYIDVAYDDEFIQDNIIKLGKFELNNIERQQGITWGLRYEYIRSEYEVSLPWEYQIAEASLGYWVSGSTRLFVSGGAETDIDNLLEPNLDQDFWEAGFQYASRRMNLELAAGERFYGTSYRLDFEYQLRRGTTTLEYSETPTTGAQLPLGTRPITDETGDLDGILDEPGRSDRFLRKRLDWTTTIASSKSTFTFRLFAEIRDDRRTGLGIPLPDEEFAGVAVRWAWRMGDKTTLGIGGDLARREDELVDDDLRRYYVDLEYRFNQRFSVRSEVVHSSQEGEEVGEFDYTENQLRIFLRTEF